MQITSKKYYNIGIHQFLPFILILLLTNACTSRINDSDDTDNSIVNPVGNNDYFEIATWNLENFPKNNGITINTVKQLILDMKVDLFAVQEIGDVSAFNSLMDSLPGWKSILSGDVYSNGSYQKTGIIFNSAYISVSSSKNIFLNDTYAFPRPPLTAHIQIKDFESVKYDFNIIVLHLKANTSSDNTTNEERRKEAVDKLQQYISDEISSGADPDFIVLGDWNDQIDDSIHTEALGSFLRQTQDYLFLTQGLNQESYISSSFHSLIDHILITQDSFLEYGIGETAVRYLDNEFTNYPSIVSDHRPVVAKFKGFKLKLN